MSLVHGDEVNVELWCCDYFIVVYLSCINKHKALWRKTIQILDSVIEFYYKKLLWELFSFLQERK